MHGTSLYDFYEKALLPQFDIRVVDVWHGSEDVGPGETVHYFSANGTDYALIFEDAGGLGIKEDFVKKVVRLKNDTFEYVLPTSHSDFAPSYPITFPTPYVYCVNVTGIFTLIKL